MTTTQVRAPTAPAASTAMPLASYDQLKPSYTTSEWLLLRAVDPKWKFIERVEGAAQEEADQRAFLLSLKKRPIGALTLPDRGSSTGGRMCRSRHGGLSLVPQPNPRSSIGSLTIADDSETEGRTGGAFSLNEQRRLDRHALIKQLIDTGHISEEEAKALGYTVFDVAAILRKRKLPATGGIPFDRTKAIGRVADVAYEMVQKMPRKSRGAATGSGLQYEDLPQAAPSFEPGYLTLPDDAETEGMTTTGGESYIPSAIARRAFTSMQQIQRDLARLNKRFKSTSRSDPEYRELLSEQIRLEDDLRAAHAAIEETEVDVEVDAPGQRGVEGGLPIIPIITTVLPIVAPLIFKGLSWIWKKITGKGVNPPNAGGLYPPNYRGSGFLSEVMSDYMKRNGSGLARAHRRLMKQEGKDFWRGAVKMAKGVISDVLPELMDTTPKVAKKMAGMVMSKFIPASFQRYCATSHDPSSEGGRKARRAKKPGMHKRKTGFTVKSAGKTLAKWAGLKILDNVPDAKELKAEISKAIDEAPEPEATGSGESDPTVVGQHGDFGMEGAGEDGDDDADDVVGGPGDQGMEGAGEEDEDGEESYDSEDDEYEGTGIREALKRVKDAAVKVKNKVVGFLPGAKTWTAIKDVAKVALTKVLPMVARVGEHAIGPAVQFVLGKLGVDESTIAKAVAIITPAAKAAAEYARRRDKEVIEAERLAEKRKKKADAYRADEDLKAEARARERQRVEDEKAPKRDKKRAEDEEARKAKAEDKKAQTEIARQREDRLRLEQERLLENARETTKEIELKRAREIVKAAEDAKKAAEDATIEREKQLTAAKKVLGKVEKGDPTAAASSTSLDEDEDDEEMTDEQWKEIQGGVKKIPKYIPAPLLKGKKDESKPEHPYHTWKRDHPQGTLREWMLSIKGTGKKARAKAAAASGGETAGEGKKKVSK